MQTSDRTLARDARDPELKQKGGVTNCVKCCKHGKSEEGGQSLKRWCLTES